MVLQLLLVQHVLLLLLLVCHGRAGGQKEFSGPSGEQEDFSGPSSGQEDFSGPTGGHSTLLSTGRHREDLRVRRSLEQEPATQEEGREEEGKQEEERQEEGRRKKAGGRHIQKKRKGREGEDRVGLFSCRQLCTSLIYDVYMLMGGRICKC